MDSLTPLDLNGIPFQRKPIRSLSTGGTPYSRWVPFGMPQLGEYKWIMDTVFFLYPNRISAQSGADLGGTGFLVAIPSTRWPDEYFHVHGVTNWHVACQGSSVVRVNKRDGSAADIFDFDPSEWTFIGGGCDLAISPPLALDPTIHKAEAFGLDALASMEEETERDIDAAEDIFMLGRFIDMDGSETNTPAFRFGNISVTRANIKQPTGFIGRSIIADMHSRTGFSGSPVLIYRTPGSVFLSNLDLSVTWKYIKLIGMLWGQYPELWEIRDSIKTTDAESKTSLITEGKHVKGMSGMSCLIPAQAIIDLLDHNALKSAREAVEVALVTSGNKFGLIPKPMVNTQPISEGSVRSDLELTLRAQQEAALAQKGYVTRGQALALAITNGSEF